MKADTFAKLIILQALVEADVGYFLETRPTSLEQYRDGMVSRISDLIDDIDLLDAPTAGRVYDAVVDFLADLPEQEEGVVDAAIRFRSAVDRIIGRGMDRRYLGARSTWATAVDELLAELADEYHEATTNEGVVRSREFARVDALLERAREAAGRMLWLSGPDDELRAALEGLSFAVRNRRLPATEVDRMIAGVSSRTAKYRPSSLHRIGGFVLSQVLRRARSRRAAADGGLPRPDPSRAPKPGRP